MDDLVLSSTATAAPSQQAVATSLHAWTAFLAHALAVRLDVETFAEFAPRLAARHPLGPRLIAEVLLRPPGAAGDSGGISSAGSGSGKGKTDGSFKRAVARGGNTNSSNSWGPDPRIPRYLDVLLDLRLVDVPGVLAAVWRYSTAHELADAAPGGPGALKAFGLGARPRKKAARRGKQSAGGNDADVMDLDSEGDDVPLSASPVRWRSSFAAEEGIFYRLTKSVAQGSGIRGTRDAALMATGLARWMALFAVASSSLLTAQAEDDEEDGNKHGRGQGTASGTTTAMAKAEQARHEMESARAAFIMLLLATCENPVVLRTLALPSPFAETARRALGEALAAFVPSILQASTEPIVQKLERFRTETLTSFEPVDGRAEAAKAEIDELLDSTMGLDAVVLPEVPVVNTRAGLYIYLNAAVSRHRTSLPSSSMARPGGMGDSAP